MDFNSCQFMEGGKGVHLQITVTNTKLSITINLPCDILQRRENCLQDKSIVFENKAKKAGFDLTGKNYFLI